MAVAEILRLSSLIIINGILLMMILCRGLMLWQQGYTWRGGWILLMYACLFGLFSARVLMLPIQLIVGAYVCLIVALAVCTIYEWNDLIAFQHRRARRDGGVEP